VSTRVYFCPQQTRHDGAQEHIYRHDSVQETDSGFFPTPIFFVRSDLQFPSKQKKQTYGCSRAWRTDRTCAATRRRAGLNHPSQHLRHWLPARDNQASGPGNEPFSSLQSLYCTSYVMRSVKHCTSPSLLRTTHKSESVRQPGQSTTSTESSKVKNPHPILHLIQHHLALLHASSLGNDHIGSSDLLDSGG